MLAVPAGVGVSRDCPGVVSPPPPQALKPTLLIRTRASRDRPGCGVLLIAVSRLMIADN
jgi:hypothetical protein